MTTTQYFLLEHPQQNEQSVDILEVRGQSANHIITLVEGVKSRDHNGYHPMFPPSKYAEKWIRRYNSLEEIQSAMGFIDLKPKLVGTLEAKPINSNKAIVI